MRPMLTAKVPPKASSTKITRSIQSQGTRMSSGSDAEESGAWSSDGADSLMELMTAAGASVGR